MCSLEGLPWLPREEEGTEGRGSSLQKGGQGGRL